MADSVMSVGEEPQVLTLDQIIEKFLAAVCNRSVDVNYKGYLLMSMSLMCKHDAEMAEQLSTSLVESLQDYDQVDF